MKKTDYLFNTLIYFLYIFFSCLCALAIEALVVKIIDRLVVLNYFQLTLIRAVIYCVTTFSLIFIFAFFEGYREAKFHLPTTIFPSVLALIPHFLFSLLFKFSGFISGAVIFVSGLIKHGLSISNTEQLSGTSYKTVIPVYVLFGIIYCLIITGAKLLGKTKRLSDREKLTGKR